VIKEFNLDAIQTDKYKKTLSKAISHITFVSGDTEENVRKNVEYAIRIALKQSNIYI